MAGQRQGNEEGCQILGESMKIPAQWPFPDPDMALSFSHKAPVIEPVAKVKGKVAKTKMKRLKRDIAKFEALM